jgi:selenocysteine lyase/cysteine desulfurase
VGADPELDAVIMVKNTTEAINKLSYRLNLQPQDIVVSTMMEHHSNELPWRAKARVNFIGLNANGQLDMDDAQLRLRQGYPRVKLLTVCGASNVTGHSNDVYLLAEMAHEYGCRILVDGAQLIPHRGFNLKPHGDPAHIDFLAFSGHKMYAPFGIGVLIGPREIFNSGPPEYSGGGTVKLVMDRQIFWADPPDRDEAGSPNVIGTYAMARTIEYLNTLGMGKLSRHEQQLTDYILQQLSCNKDITVYGTQPRVGVISFNLRDMPHALVGAILGFEAGIGVRTGCFCAQRYVRNLLGVKEDIQHLHYFEQQQTDLIPGMVRVSLGAYNNRKEVDYLLHWLRTITANRNEFKRRYRLSRVHGGFIPVGLDYNAFCKEMAGGK